MKHAAWALLAAMLWPHPAAAQEIDADTLTRLRRSTVFVKATFLSGISRGTGFVIDTDKSGRIRIATNAHIVRLLGRDPIELRIVLDSGEKAEREIAARVTAIDEDEDLAVLEATAPKPPEPIAVAPSPELRQTMRVFAFGYPFGEALGGRGGNPSITVSSGTVSAIRRDEAGDPAVLQISGDLNPGNSGGPLVDARGRLLGIATAKVRNTQIGMAIPVDRLRRLLVGRAGEVDIVEDTNDGRAAVYRLEVATVDPLRRVERFVVVDAAADNAIIPPPPNDTGWWDPIAPVDKAHALTVDDGVASGRLSLAVDPKGPSNRWVQVGFRVDDKWRFTEPRLVRIAPPIGADKPVAAGDDDDGGWLGSDLDDEEKVRFTGKPEAVNNDLATEPFDVDDITVTRLDLDIEPMLRVMVTVDDGRALALVTRNGMLRRIDAKTLRLTHELNLGNECHGLTVSNVGLVVTMRVIGEVWVIDPSTLAIRRRIAVPGVLGSSAAIGSDRAVCMIAGGGRFNQSLAIVDLTRGRIVHSAPTDSLVAPEFNFDRALLEAPPITQIVLTRMTPDGRHLFAVSNVTLHRIALADDRFDYEQSGGHYGSNPRRIDVSDDGRYVTFITGIGNTTQQKRPDVGYYATFVHPVDDLAKEIAVIKHGKGAQCIVFDRVNRMIYTSSNDHDLIVFEPSGRKRAEYKFARVERPTTQTLLAHPPTRSVFVLGEKKLFRAQFKTKGP